MKRTCGVSAIPRVRMVLAIVLSVCGCQCGERDRRPNTGAEAESPSPPEASTATPEVQIDPVEELWSIDDLTLERQSWTVGDVNGWAWRARVPLPGQVRVLPSDAVVSLGDLVPDDAGPWAAINGGFYEDGPMGLVVSEGDPISPLTKRGGSGVFLVDEAGPRIIHRDDWKTGPSEALQSVDRIVDAGASLVHARPDARLAARAAVVVGESNLWLVCAAAAGSVAHEDPGTVQLQQTVGRGLTLASFADYVIVSTDAKQALNLDGSISVQMAVRAGERRFRVLGEAGTINGLVIHPSR